MTLSRVVVHETVAAVNLDVFVADEVECFAAGDLRDGRLHRVLLERVERGRSVRGGVVYSERGPAPARVEEIDARVDETCRPVEQALDRIRSHHHLANLV